MRAVNLLPRDEAKTTRKRTPLPVLVGSVTAIVVTGILGAGFVVESRHVSQNRSDLDAARAELATVPPPSQPDPGAIALANEESPRTAALQQALNGRVALDRVLREISLVVPHDVWLNTLALVAPATAPTDAPPPDATVAPAPAAVASTAFMIDGNAYSHEGVARFLSRLQLVPDLEGVTLGSSMRTTPRKRSAFHFVINAGIRAPGGSS